ncbi:hypothetical protein [Desulfovibrio sp.]|uniref:hypothetical protein n=1 Tax=Desulfovibrio sp. TaxID=885 RepID=UPI00343A3A16
MLFWQKRRVFQRTRSKHYYKILPDLCRGKNGSHYRNEYSCYNAFRFNPSVRQHR